jgi:hypothetical protein
MDRRELIKIAALTAISRRLNALPMQTMDHMHAPLPAAAAIPPFFTDEEKLFLDQAMEMIIPADEHSPGAHEAQTSLFADLMVSTDSDAVKKQWRDGIRLLQMEAKETSLAGAMKKASLNEEDPKTDLERFFVQLKGMTIDGYYTSQIGIHQEMEYKGNAYLGAFPGCSQPEPPKA